MVSNLNEEDVRRVIAKTLVELGLISYADIDNIRFNYKGSGDEIKENYPAIISESVEQSIPIN
jgi:hypothetical protein